MGLHPSTNICEHWL